jgi:photosystem II stability/assembly factor-like uncharacterized protein
MRSRLPLSLFLLALAGCDRLTMRFVADGGADSLAGKWEQVDAGTVNYNAVAGSSPDNVMVVGDQGTILHWNGAALLREESGTVANLRGVAVVDETLAYAVGDQGTVLRRQDSAWLPEAPLTGAVLNAVCAGASYAVAVGEQGTVLIANQGVWTLAANNRNDNYYAVTDTGAGPLIVGSLGVMVQPDVPKGTMPTALPPHTDNKFKVVAGAGRYGGGALLVGLDGTVFVWTAGAASRIDFVSGTEQHLTPQKFLRAVSESNGNAWLVGHEGLVLTMVPGSPPTFTVIPTPDDRWLLGVYAASASDIWIVGRSGLILRGPPGVRGVPDGGIP